MTEREKGDKEGRVAEILKKIMNTGLGAAFMTEDVVKGVLADLAVPKELLQNLVQSAKSSKEEFMGTVQNGVKEYLNQLDLSKEVGRIMENYDLEMRAKFSLKKKPAPPAPKEKK
jgi:hypothetical protein